MDKGEEGNYDGQGKENYSQNYGDEGYKKNYGYENKGEGDEYYYGNGNQQNYDGYGKEGAKTDENVGQISQGTKMKKSNSRDEENFPHKNANNISPSNNPIISEKEDIFDLDNPPLRNRSNTTFGFHSSFQAKRAAQPKLIKNNNQYQNNTCQNPVSTLQSINNPLPKSSLAPSKSLNQSYTNNTANLIKPYEIKPVNYKSNTIEKNLTRNLYTPQSHSHAFIVNGLVYYTRCPNCNYALNVDPKSVETSNQNPNIIPSNQRNKNNYNKDSYKSKTIESQNSLRALRTEPNSNQREDRRLREQKEREDKKLRDKKEMEEKLKRQREERDRKFREERERKEREKKEQKEKQQREFQRLMEQKEKERNEKRDKDQQQRNLRSQGNQGYQGYQGYQPNQRKEYKYTTQTKNSEYYQNKTITKKVIENPTVPKNYYINEKGVVVIVPPKSVKTSVTKIVTVNKPVNSIYQSDGRSFGKSNNMGFYQSQAVETKVIVKPYRK